MAQWKRAGLITRRSLDRNQVLLPYFLSFSFCYIFWSVEVTLITIAEHVGAVFCVRKVFWPIEPRLTADHLPNPALAALSLRCSLIRRKVLRNFHAVGWLALLNCALGLAMILLSLALLAAFAPLVFCQFPPTPEGVTTLKSKYHEGVTISYKEVQSIL